MSSPVLTDVKLAFEGMDVYDAIPQERADLFADKPIVVVRQVPRQADGRAGHREQRNGRIDGACRWPGERVGRQRRARYLWPGQKIRVLSDYNHFSGQPETRKQIVDLGLKYNLLTEFTSFVAVDNSRPADKEVAAEVHAQPSGSVPEPHEWSLIALGVLLLVFLLFANKGRSMPEGCCVVVVSLAGAAGRAGLRAPALAGHAALRCPAVVRHRAAALHPEPRPQSPGGPVSWITAAVFTLLHLTLGSILALRSSAGHPVPPGTHPLGKVGTRRLRTPMLHLPLTRSFFTLFGFHVRSPSPLGGKVLAGERQRAGVDSRMWVTGRSSPWIRVAWGSALVITAFILSLLIMQQVAKRNGAAASALEAVSAFLALSLVLVIIANFFRIVLTVRFRSPAGSVSHESIGLVTLAVFHCSPCSCWSAFPARK